MVFQFNILQISGLSHGITMRNSSQGEFSFDSKNSNIESNLDLLKKQLLLPKNPIFPIQTHTNIVKTIGLNTTLYNLNNVDGLVTNDSNLPIAIQTADCIPVLLYDQVSKIIGALHAGWRGTMGNIVKEGVHQFKKLGSNPKNIVAGIGPGICQDIYEVGGEVLEKANSVMGSDSHQFIIKTSENKGKIDLKGINKHLLVREGLKPENIEISDICTFLAEEDYYSARREGIETGRMASVIMLKEEKPFHSG